MELLVAVVSGFSFGCLHAFDADHMAAVTAFATKERRAARAAMFGLTWGLGHSATLLLLGVCAIAFKVVVPAFVGRYAEILAGFLLIVIGLWTIRDLLRARHLHAHRHAHDGFEHVHLHSHATSTQHSHRHSLFFVGATHGVAGTAAVLVIIPVTLAQSTAGAIAYLLLFSLGTIVAMGFFAHAIGSVARRAEMRTLNLIRLSAGLMSVAVGLIWLSRSLEVA